MKSKNLEHLNFAKAQQEIVTSINEVGQPALFVNTLSDIEKISQQNEFLNNQIRIWVIGSLPAVDWMQFIGCDIAKDADSLNNGETNRYEVTVENETLQISVSKIEHVVSGLITGIQPLLTVVIAHEITDDQHLETLRLLSEDLPWLQILDINQQIPASFKKELSQKSIQFDVVELNAEVPELPSIGSYFIHNSQEKKSIHQTFLSLNQIRKVIKTLSLIASKEQNNIISKKAITQQKIQLIPDSRNNNAADIIQKIKQLILQYSSNYEKSTTTATELFVQSNQHDGLKSYVEQLNEKPILFSETPKSKNIELTLDTQYEKTLIKDLRDLIVRKCSTDIQIFMDTLHVLEKDIEQLLESQGIVFQRTNMKFITQNEMEYFINHCFSKQIEYSGTAPNKGMYEYFSAARKFQMVFFMMASVFGVSGLIRKYQFVSIPLSIVLLGYGIISVSKSVAKERIENEEKETKSAKEAIDRWLKDIGSELTRNWTKTLLDAFRSQLNTLNMEVESTLKTTLVQRNAELEDERKRQQKSFQTFEASERKLELVHRNVQTMERNIQRLLSDSRGNFNQLLRSERDANRDASSITDRRSSRTDRRTER